jgi:hypothetical protein
MEKISERRRAVYKALIEIGFIIFLFYSNLLMGQYNLGHNFAQRPILEAIKNICTIDNFGLAVIAAFIGHVAFDRIRRRL